MPGTDIRYAATCFSYRPRRCPDTDIRFAVTILSHHPMRCAVLPYAMLLPLCCHFFPISPYVTAVLPYAMVYHYAATILLCDARY
eukprot:3940327-Rhodomonas_salina.1